MDDIKAHTKAKDKGDTDIDGATEGEEDGAASEEEKGEQE